MDLKFDLSLAENYRNSSQITRVLTENWMSVNGYCLNCSASSLTEFPNNRPVADFYCASCGEQYELKSKKGKSMGKKVLAGAYSSMIQRIQSSTNPHFFFLSYDPQLWQVNNLLIVPNFFFTSSIVEKRKPLPAHARRAGWIGCNIALQKIPKDGRIFLVQQSTIVPPKQVRQQWQKTLFLKQQSAASKGWTVDILHCIDRLPSRFTLKECYQFVPELQQKHPHNNFIKAKIRQQLQLLREKGFIQFLSRGVYQKIN